MHIELDRYARLKSPIHSWDPRFKIISLSALIFAFSFTKQLTLLPFIFVISIIVLLLSRLPLLYIFKRLKYIALFMVPMVILLSTTSGGKVLFSLKFIPVYAQGLTMSLLVVVRTFAILIVFFVMLETTPFNRTIKALHAIKMPDKLVSILFFTYRYIYVYLEELRKMRIALKLRGYKNAMNYHSLKTNGGIVASLLLRSFEQAERICSAMTLRGYTGKFIIRAQFRACWQDYVKEFAVALVIIILLKTTCSL
ncbi:MAG: cobalt ECF transporter T component CbiQ [Actinobacteria bacterium]|nr:cobalt ECF transporter T component CbiQ [Actinomycetota bacterium]